jgi:hypothetical protein
MSLPLSRPPMLLLLWVAILLPPGAWLTMLGVQWSWTNESCVWRREWPMHFLAIAAVAVAMLPGIVAWPRWRNFDVSSAAAERTRFMLGLAVGASAIFTLVTLLSAVPVWFLDPCRT